MAGSGKAVLRGDDIDIVLRVEGLVVEFPARRGQVVHAVSDVSFDLAAGETLGVVGESGCGKTTLGRSVMRLEDAAVGDVLLRGNNLGNLSGDSLRQARRRMQMIFQDPVSSLNPSRRVQDLVREGLRIWGRDDDEYVDEVMRAVGLDPESAADRRAHEFSGGQCQRICIARALVMEPNVLILDEPVSALDVSVQAQILNLLESLKATYDLTMVFISHDLAVVKNISDRVMVMYLGKTCELAATDDLFAQPAHPYTRALLASIPGNELGLPPATELISGELPSPVDPPSGCRFRTRCPQATELCATDEPVLRALPDSPDHPDSADHSDSTDHFVACHHPHH